MARTLRFEYPVAIYHVIVRGDGCKTVFENEADCEWISSTVWKNGGRVRILTEFPFPGHPVVRRLFLRPSPRPRLLPGFQECSASLLAFVGLVLTFGFRRRR